MNNNVCIRSQVSFALLMTVSPFLLLFVIEQIFSYFHFQLLL